MLTAISCRTSSTASTSAADPVPDTSSTTSGMEGLDGLVIDGNPCKYSVQVDWSAGTVAIGLAYPENGVLVLKLPRDAVPLADGAELDVGSIQSSINVDAKLNYDGKTLKFKQQGRTDFLETRWAEIEVDPTLRHPTKAKMKSGFGGLSIPFSWHKCEFPWLEQM